MLLISEKKVDAEASAKYTHLSFRTVPAVAKPPTFSPRMLPFLWKLWGSVGLCRKIIREFGADAVLGMGGFTSLPPVYAGHRLGLKTFIHDSNARPGRANVLTSRFCTRVFLGLDAAKPFFPKRETTTTGTPVRPEFTHPPSLEDAAALFGLEVGRPTIVVTGGTLRPKQHSLVDPLAGSFLKTLSVDTVFLGCNGIHPSAGITNVNLPEANVKRAMIEASQRCVVMADSSKIGTRALASVCTIDDVDVIVLTDSDVRDTDVDWLKERGVDVIVA